MESKSLTNRIPSRKTNLNMEMIINRQNLVKDEIRDFDNHNTSERTDCQNQNQNQSQDLCSSQTNQNEIL